MLIGFSAAHARTMRHVQLNQLAQLGALIHKASRDWTRLRLT